MKWTITVTTTSTTITTTAGNGYDPQLGHLSLHCGVQRRPPPGAHGKNSATSRCAGYPKLDPDMAHNSTASQHAGTSARDYGCPLLNNQLPRQVHQAGSCRCWQLDCQLPCQAGTCQAPGWEWGRTLVDCQQIYWARCNSTTSCHTRYTRPGTMDACNLTTSCGVLGILSWEQLRSATQPPVGMPGRILA